MPRYRLLSIARFCYEAKKPQSPLFIRFRFITSQDHAMRPNRHMDRSFDSHARPLAIRRNFIARSAIGGLLVLSAWTFGLASASPVKAGECNQDIGALTQKRQSVIEQLNKLAKHSPKGQLDPIASCPKLRALAAIEQKLSAYLTKNKDWCMVPDAAVTNMAASAKRTQAVAGQACKVAEQIKKGQQAIGTGPKLPTGPL
jgi:hypothetical protein